MHTCYALKNRLLSSTKKLNISLSDIWMFFGLSHKFRESRVVSIFTEDNCKNYERSRTDLNGEFHSLITRCLITICI